MQTQSMVTLRLLFNHFHPDVQLEKMLRRLPPEQTQAVMAQEVSSDDLALLVVDPEEALKCIHYSWILVALKRFPEQMQQTLVHALPQETAVKLASLLPKKPATIMHPFAKVIRHYLLSKLYEQVKPTEILPIALLPKSPLLPLAKKDKQQLIDFIDLLAMFDVADEMRYIIDRQRVQNLFKFLTAKQRQFLHVCVHQTERVASSSLGLDQFYDQSKEQALHRLLHRRGLIRLAKALSGEHPDLIWHLSRILDTGRGETLLGFSSEQASKKVTDALIQQVTTLMNFLTPSTPP